MVPTFEPKICFLGYSRLYSMAREVIDSLGEKSSLFLLFDCDLNSQDECVREALDAGCEIFVSGAGNAAQFRNRYHLPLVEINIKPMDYALAIRRAANKGAKKIAIVRHRQAAPVNRQELEMLLEMPLTEIEFESLSEMFTKVARSDCDCVVSTAGGIVAAEAAGKEGILIYSGTEEIREACLRALERLEELQERRKSREMTRAILQNSQLGIIVTDAEGKIEIFNRMAQSYTGLQSAQVRGLSLDEFHPNLSVQPLLKGKELKNDGYKLVDGAMMRVIQEKIRVRDKTVGVLVTLRPEAHNRKDREKNVTDLHAHIYHWNELIARSDAMKKLVEDGKALTSDSDPTLILTEFGSGAEEIAYCIHGGSSRAQYPCITVDLATLPEQDAPRILLGYAREDRYVDGLFFSANKGSIVFKNMDKAKPSAVACIQELLNGRQILRPGMGAALTPDIWLFTIARPEDFAQVLPHLASQLSIHTLVMPSLSDRKEDVEGIFLKYLAQLSDFPRKYRLTEEMRTLLREYRWPGNVQELRAVSARYARQMGNEKLSPNGRYLLLLNAIGKENVFRDLLRTYPVLKERKPEDPERYLQAVREAKKVLHCSNEQIADLLGIGRTSLWRLMRETSEE